MDDAHNHLDDIPNYDRILGNIRQCHDIDKLTTFAANARKRNVEIVESAALKQLNTLVPAYKMGSYEKAFWDMLLTYQTLLFEHGKPMLRLNKAWKDAVQGGEVKAHSGWIENGHQIWALDSLIEGGKKSKTAEAVALKFGDLFHATTKAAAENNLELAKARISEKQ